MWPQRVEHQQFQPSIGPYGGQWTMCAVPKQMQPHPHSEVPVGVQTTGVSGSFQTDSRYIPKWICFLYHQLKEVNLMSSVAQVAGTYPLDI